MQPGRHRSFIRSLLALILVLGLVPSTLDDMRVTFLEVGQGDSIWVRLPDDEDLLIDGGPEAKSGTLRDYLSEHGAGDTEYLLLIHPDADHSGGLIPVLQSLTALRFWYNGQDTTVDVCRRFKCFVDTKQIPTSIQHAGDTYNLGGATLAVLHAAMVSGETHRNSLACRFSYCGIAREVLS